MYSRSSVADLLGSQYGCRLQMKLTLRSNIPQSVFPLSELLRVINASRWILRFIYLHVLNTQCHHVCYPFSRYSNCKLFETVSRWPSLAAAGFKRLYDRFRPCRVNGTRILKTDAGVYIISKRWAVYGFFLHVIYLFWGIELTLLYLHTLCVV